MLKYIFNGLTKQGFAIEKKLFVYDDGQLMNTYGEPKNSGIRATVFGASSFVGRQVFGNLAQIGSQMVLPLNLQFHWRHSEHLKELRVFGHTNKCWVSWDLNLKNEKMINDLVKNSNVVVNLLGPRTNIKKRSDFEWINIEVADRIAHACKKNGVLRLIHFSAAGAEADSKSLDFQTKFQGEAVVRKTFPNATIFRPCTMYGMNDHFASIVQRQMNFFFNKFVPVYDDCMAKKQPIQEYDIAQCVLNALKMDESKGKTYELGGPNVFTMLQIYEIIFNTMKMRPSIAYIDRSVAELVAKYIYNWQFFSQQTLRKSLIDEVVKEDRYLTIKDLKVQPLSFKNGIFEIVRQYAFDPKDRDQNYEN